ncbi:uncharacterized protein LOC144026010 isoform X3 [Festucalex cinctus]
MANPEEDDQLLEQIDEEVQDEGFVEEEPEDLSVPILYDLSEPIPFHGWSHQVSLNPSLPQTAAFSQGLPPQQSPQQSSAQPSAASTTNSVVADQAPAPVLGPYGIAGWDKVQDLALYLDEQQVVEVIHLWTCRQMTV